MGGSESAGPKKPRFIDSVYKVTTGEKPPAPAEAPKKRENPPPDPAELFERLAAEEDPTKRGALLVKVVQALKEQVRLSLGDYPGGIYQEEMDKFLAEVQREYGDKWNEPALMRALIGEKGGFKIDASGRGLDFPGKFSVVSFLGRLKQLAKAESMDDARSLND